MYFQMQNMGKKITDSLKILKKASNKCRGISSSDGSRKWINIRPWLGNFG